VNDTTYASGCDFPDVKISSEASNSSYIVRIPSIIIRTDFVSTIEQCVDICRKNKQCSSFVAFSTKQNNYFCTLRKGQFSLDDSKPFKLAIKVDEDELRNLKSTCGLIESM
jgi:hypothetical protein